jgi:hypothetical protein
VGCNESIKFSIAWRSGYSRGDSGVVGDEGPIPVGDEVFPLRNMLCIFSSDLT